LSVRKIDDDVYERLKTRARNHGVSMEEEVRRLIAQSVSAPENLAALARRCFGPEHGVVLEIPPRQPHEPLEFEE
jgi:plasmid stability protein